MIVRDYFETKRDAAGRAWLDSPCWIERVGTEFLLRFRSNTLQMSPGDRIDPSGASALSFETDAVPVSKEPIAPAPPEMHEQTLSAIEPEVACHFEAPESSEGWQTTGDVDAEAEYTLDDFADDWGFDRDY